MYRQLYPVTYYFYPLLEHLLEDSPFASVFQGMLQAPKPAPTENLLYVHIPFCHDLCRFCPFHVKVAQDESYGDYVRALKQEIEQVSRLPYLADTTFDALYFGGGSPSIIGVQLVAELFASLRQNFRLKPGIEISFEGEPRTLGDERLLDLLAEQGVSRISFGLQTYHPKIRELFNIVATLEDIDRVTRNARARGFTDINVDMMYDLPGQDIAALEYDLEHLAQHGFDSIDYYNLHYYAFPKKMKTAMANGALPGKPDADMHMALQEQLNVRLRGMGYTMVADQVFSRLGRVCEYFRLLWGGGGGDYSAETVAIGASARGYLGGYAYMNHGNTAQYIKRVAEGHLPIEKISSPLDRVSNRGEVFFPKFFRIDDRFAAEFSPATRELLAGWTREGLVYPTRGGGFQLSEAGKRWTTNMMVDLAEEHQRRLAHDSEVKLSARAGSRTGSF